MKPSATSASLANLTTPSVHTVQSPLKPTVLILASGRGSRFVASGGFGNKLNAQLGHTTVLEHTLAAVRASELPWHLETASHPGMGDSIAAAVLATSSSPGWLVLPGDLPLVKTTTILAIAQAIFKGAQTAYPVSGGLRGHPVGFCEALGNDLLQLQGDKGAAWLLNGLNAIEIHVDDFGCMQDVDTVEDLKRVEFHSKTSR